MKGSDKYIILRVSLRTIGRPWFMQGFFSWIQLQIITIILICKYESIIKYYYYLKIHGSA